MTKDAPRWLMLGSLVLVGHLGAFAVLQSVVPESTATMLGETNIITAIVSVEEDSQHRDSLNDQVEASAEPTLNDPKLIEPTLADPLPSTQATVSKATEDKAVKPTKAAPKVVPKRELRSQTQVTKPAPSKPAKTNTAPPQSTNLKTSSGVETGRGEKTGSASVGASANTFVGPSASADYLNNPYPKYPKLSLRRKEVGTVWLTLTVTAEGFAKDVRVKETSGYARLDKAALEAVKRWRFRPARRSGQPVDAEYELPIHFKLKE